MRPIWIQGGRHECLLFSVKLYLIPIDLSKSFWSMWCSLSRLVCVSFCKSLLVGIRSAVLIWRSSAIIWSRLEVLPCCTWSRLAPLPSFSWSRLAPAPSLFCTCSRILVIVHSSCFWEILWSARMLVLSSCFWNAPWFVGYLLALPSSCF